MKDRESSSSSSSGSSSSSLHDEDPISLISTSMEEDVLLDEMLQELTPEEVEVAAKAFYEYLVQPDVKQTQKFAKRFALRFLQSKDGDIAAALSRLKATLQFRSEMKVDQLCTAFDDHINGRQNKNTINEGEKNRDEKKENEDDHDHDTERNIIADRLEQEMKHKNLYVQGYDKEGRSTYIFIPRNVEHHDEEWTLKQHIYTLERAVAASKAPDKTVNAMVDFNGFAYRNIPPTQIGHDFMMTFRYHYAGVINRIYLVDAPTIFSYLWTLFSPLIGQKTRHKIHFIQSSDQNDLNQFYEPDQAASWMMPGGKKNRELNVHEYLYEIPFDHAFDE